MLYIILYYFILFLIYSHLGWIMEVIYTYIDEKKLINRGFLIGPICPIYGVGLLLITNLLNNYTNTPLVLFILSIVICMTLEYLTSYIMERLFNARWWDYSDRRFNINGRICLETSIPFGLGGLFIMYLVNPFLHKLLDLVNHNIITTVGLILSIFFITDVIISYKAIGKIKNFILKKYQDNTEEINNKVRAYIKKISPQTKRIIESFPNIRIKINNIASNIKNKVKRNK